MSWFKTSEERRAAREEKRAEREAYEEAKKQEHQDWLKSCSLYYIKKDDDEYYAQMDTDKISLTDKWNELNRTRRYMENGWSRERLTEDMFKLSSVQSLWDATVSLYRKLSWMKEMAIKHGVARYNEKGQFEWLEVNEDRKILTNPEIMV